MGNVNRQVSLAITLAVCIAGSFGCRAWADTGQVPKRDLSAGKTSVSAKSGKVKGSEVKLQAQKAAADMPPVAPDRVQVSDRSPAKTSLYGSAVANNSDSMPPLAPQLAKFGRAPLIGAVTSNNTASIQLGNPQQAQFGQQPQLGQQPFSVPVTFNRVPQLPVHQTPIGVANVTEPTFKQAIPLIHVGMGMVPGLRGMSCPVCGLLNKL
jgi:hypothetical protein